MQDQNNKPINIKNYNKASEDEIWIDAISPVFFSNPIVVPQSAWAEHIPFAFWIINALQPKLLVELGTHYGLSYFSFCQAIQQKKLSTKCFAIDTWKGDEHAGYYDDSVFEFVDKANQRFSSFSTLYRSTFDDAVFLFNDKSIDLLHIDGLHTYEAVKHDFYNWLPKISDSGLVIFHDTNVMERGFGVYLLWEELTKEYPFFEFKHGYGLGILGIGKKIPLKINQLFNAGLVPELRLTIQDLYQRIGYLSGIEQEYYKITGAINIKKEPENNLTKNAIVDSSKNSSKANLLKVEKYLYPLQKIGTQVYWKKQGEEFSEINSIIQSIELSISNTSYIFKINRDFSTIKKLRIDPATEQGVFYLHSISIINSSGTILLGWEAIKELFVFYNLLIIKSTLIENAFVLISTTNDPIIEIDLQSLNHASKTDDINLIIGFSKLNDEVLKKEFSNITLGELKREQNNSSLQIYDKFNQSLQFARKEIIDLISSKANNILLQYKNDSIAKDQKFEKEKDNIIIELKEQRLLFEREILEAKLASQKKQETINELLKEIARLNGVQNLLKDNFHKKDIEVKSLTEALKNSQKNLADLEFSARGELNIAKKQSEELLKELEIRISIIDENQKEMLIKENIIRGMLDKISEYKEMYENNSILGIIKGRLKKIK